MSRPLILFITDTHCPWQDDKRIEEVRKWAVAEKPRLIVHLGDVMDQYLLSRFPKDNQRIFSPRTVQLEIARTVKLLRTFSSLTKMMWVPGNHDLRILKEIARTPFLEAYIGNPLANLAKDGGVILTSKRGVRMNNPGTKQLALRHEGSKAFYHKVRDFCVIQGHYHRLLCHWVTSNLFALECGHLAKQHAPCFDYYPLGTSEWKSGFAWIDHRGRPYTEAL